ncbi:PIN domain-containing protein [Haloglycomyces albus]|uniref:PIN domain-containing protein n=1 Tax=Haloglycomyces albus TaxID=526067 RepID=UPI00046CBA97|nr:type II toxin-antitoxin system VapC family toxin [Haloglycomyces albus]
MIGLDTNVLARYIVRDDVKQAEIAEEVIDSLSAENPGFVTLITTVELYWVLSRVYRLPVSDTLEALRDLAESTEIEVEQPDVFFAGLRSAERQGSDLADALIAGIGLRAGVGCTVTFDRRAANRAGMRLIGD